MNQFDFSCLTTPFGSVVSQPMNDVRATFLPNLPAPPPVDSGTSNSPPAVHPKRKPKPSLRAQRDNAIGKENPPASESDITMHVNSRGKKRFGNCPAGQEGGTKGALKTK